MIHPAAAAIVNEALRVITKRDAWIASLQDKCATCGHAKAWHGPDGPWCDYVAGSCPCERYVKLEK